MILDKVKNLFQKQLYKINKYNYHHSKNIKSLNTYKFQNNQTYSTNKIKQSDQKSIFTSKFYILDQNTISDFLIKHNIEYSISQNDQQYVLQNCPLCQNNNKNQQNQKRVILNQTNGAFFCFRCLRQGSWFDFVKYINKDDYDITLNTLSYQTIKNQPNHYDSFQRFQNLFELEYSEIIEYLTKERKINKEILEKYQIGIGFSDFKSIQDQSQKSVPCIYFPMYQPRPSNDTQNTNQISQQQYNINNQYYVLKKSKVRGVGQDNKIYQRIEPSGADWGLFGLNTIKKEDKVLVITEGEFDAMAVNQATQLPAISLPNGASNLPLDTLPCLEQFEKIYLWMDSDQAGLLNAPKIAQKLGYRTFIVNTNKGDQKGPKDANDALKLDSNCLQSYIDQAKPMNDKNLATFKDFRLEILNRLSNFEQNQGIKSQQFEWFNSTFKGFRKGEFTILTGHTGSGKTTFLSQLSLDFCNQKIGTLWGSFEIQNEVLLETMLLQHSGDNLKQNMENYDFHADNFEQLPLWLLKYHGSTDIDSLIRTIEYAIYAHDIGHVIIDNLQFLLSCQKRGYDKFEFQDEVIYKFRKLATEKNIHVTMVIHPRKSDEKEDLDVTSVFGSSKATQECDNLLILQNRNKFKKIEITKNRYDGTLGSMAVGFVKESKRFFALAHNEVDYLIKSNNGNILQIISNREKDNIPLWLNQDNQNHQDIVQDDKQNI